MRYGDGVAPYRDIAEDLFRRIAGGEFSPGDQLPSIAALQEHYEVPGLNTIRQAQQLLVEDGLLETRQGVGAFVLRTDPRPRTVDVLAELREARPARPAPSVRRERCSSAVPVTNQCDMTASIPPRNRARCRPSTRSDPSSIDEAG